ncbi:diguanylate cyclase [Actinotalea sp.]|uniref:GGDEF domain-containing protein n=1 Tax=Actinotalea sp. TaxID=1872145 RepID=UPI003567D86A
MNQDLVPAEFGLLDPLSDIAHGSYADGFSERSVVECRAWSVLCRAIDDVVTLRYLLYVESLAHLDLGRYDEVLTAATALLDTLGDAAEPVWRCKALSVIGHATIRLDRPSAAVTPLAEAYRMLGALDPDSYGHLSASMALAMALRSANLVEASDEVFGAIRPQGVPMYEVYVAQEKALLSAHWATVLRLLGRNDEAAIQFRITAERALRMQTFARLSADWSMLARGEAIEAYGLLRLGEVDLAAHRALAAAERFLARPELFETQVVQLVLATAEAEQGLFESARERLRSVVREADQCGRSIWAAMGRAALADVDMEQHGPSEAGLMWRAVARDALSSVWAEREARFAAMRDRESIRHLRHQADHYGRVMLEDPLTGLGNRRMLSELLDGEERPDGVIFVDVDEFKAVNDRFSHAVGDRVLQAIAGILRAESRMGDHLLRYGGDEFLVLLHGSLDQARTVAARIRSGVLAHPWEELAPGLTVTVSIGVARGDDRDLLVSADRALLVAKRVGRNRVVEAG